MIHCGLCFIGATIGSVIKSPKEGLANRKMPSKMPKLLYADPPAQTLVPFDHIAKINDYHDPLTLSIERVKEFCYFVFCHKPSIPNHPLKLS